jgi:predicted DNA-binding transcriptional regulator YafY
LDTAIPLTGEEIRSKIGGYPDAQASFRRAFERDKDDLRSMGVNVRVETVPGIDPPMDGYRVDADEYAGQDPGLEADELAALHLAAALVRFEAAPEDAFWKLGGADSATDAPEAVTTVPSPEEATQLYTAIAERRTVEFTYRGLDRVFEPSRLSFKRGQWYVSGIDRTREAERVFRLDRIDGELRVGEPGAFERVDARGPELTRTWELGDESPVTARVAIDADEAIWAQVHLSAQEIVETRPDGSVVVELTVNNTSAFRDWVLEFMDNAEVLSPPELRSMMVSWLGEPAGGPS